MEETEFEHIAQEMRPRLTAHCQRYLSAGTLAEEADDIVQETLVKLWKMRERLSEYQSIEEREISFSLKEDRADVIIPAAEIFLKACEYLKCESIMVPNISLAYSIVDGLYEKMMTKTEE